MLLIVLSVVLPTIQDESAQTVYDRVRAKLDRASSIAVKADCPPDDFHTWSYWIAFKRPGSALVSDFTLSFRTNGKWTYFADVGELEHRPTQKGDLQRWRWLIGLESFFVPERRPQGIGTPKMMELPRSSGRTALALELTYSASETATLFVNPETLLPVGFRQANQGFVAYNDLALDVPLEPRAFEVRPPPMAAAVYAESQRRLKKIHTLRLARRIDGKDEEILLSRPNLLRRRIDGRTVAASSGSQKYWAWDDPPRHVWQMADLLGFEALTGSNIRPRFSGKARASSWIGDCWLLPMRIPGSKKQFQLLVDRNEKSLLPLGYAVLDGDKVLQLVEYKWITVNEKIGRHGFAIPRQ